MRTHCKKYFSQRSPQVNSYLLIKVLVVVLIALGVSAIILDKLYKKPFHLHWTDIDQDICHLSDFKVIESGSAFIYSAFIDDRRTRDVHLTNAAVVRLFVYYLRSIEAPPVLWKCSFFYRGQDNSIDTPIVSVTDLNQFSSLRFLVAMVICDLPKSRPQSVPRSVSLTNKSNSSPSAEDAVCIVDLRRSSSSLFNSNGMKQNISRKIFNNNRTTNDSKSIQDNHYATFTVCTSPIHGNYHKTEDIVNFIEVNRLLGAEKFVFYVDKDTHPLLSNCLKAYADLGIVEMYPFTPPVHDGLHYHGQILSISDCVYRTMYRTKYLLNQDLDEVIVPLKTDNWTAMLEGIHSRVRNPDLIASYSFRNQFFPIEAQDETSTEKNFLVKRYHIKALLKTLKEDFIFPHKERSKVMARPERILMWHVHMILPENVIRRDDVIHYTSPFDALLFHYRSWATKRKLLSEKRMLTFSNELTNRVHEGMSLCSAFKS